MEKEVIKDNNIITLGDSILEIIMIEIDMTTTKRESKEALHKILQIEVILVLVSIDNMFGEKVQKVADHIINEIADKKDINIKDKIVNEESIIKKDIHLKKITAIEIIVHKE